MFELSMLALEGMHGLEISDGRVNDVKYQRDYEHDKI